MKELTTLAILLNGSALLFPYDCFYDTCTFPNEFCNRDPNKQYCEPCLARVCQRDIIPPGCLYNCSRGRLPESFETTTLSPGSRGDNTMPPDCTMKLVIGVVVAIVTSVVVTVLATLGVVWYRRRRAAEDVEKRQANRELKKLLKKNRKSTPAANPPAANPPTTNPPTANPPTTNPPTANPPAANPPVPPASATGNSQTTQEPAKPKGFNTIPPVAPAKPHAHELVTSKS